LSIEVGALLAFGLIVALILGAQSALEPPCEANGMVVSIPTISFAAVRAALFAAAWALGFAPLAAHADIMDSITSGFGLFGGSKYKTEITPDIPAEDLYNQGLARLKAHDYEGAAKKFGELDKQYPLSEWARKGLLMTTYAQFEKPSYDDAVQSAQRYIGLYPKSPEVPYMYYLAGMSYYNQVPDVMRDQTSAEKALQIFTQLLEKYPQSEYAADAKYKMQIARDQLAAKEMTVGRFYLTRKNYPAAINRFHDVLGKYQSTRHTEEALYRLTEAYLAMGVPHEAQTAAAVLGHNYPDSQWYKDAHDLLKSGGLEPHEYAESWLSNLGKTLHPL
jgi:outer membrane protein assembly factor BamD